MSVAIVITYGVGQGADGFTPVTLSAAFDSAERNFRASMRHIAPELNKLFNATMKSRFAAQGTGGPVLGAWKPLSKNYAAWKRANYPGRKILTLRGYLREGMTNDASLYAWRHSNDVEFSFGTRGVPYAEFHQTGTRKMPARPPFDFGGQRFDNAFRKAGQRGIVAALKASGFRGGVTGEGVTRE